MLKFVVKNESEMIELGEKLAGALSLPCVIEMVGDVGVGKTTLVKGLARGMGVEEEVTSPSFVVNKRYEAGGAVLTHYDFYRLEDPGLMMEELGEMVDDDRAVTVVEWAESVRGVLGEDRVRVKIFYNKDEGRVVEIEGVEL
ncbi:tRNA (adenosine(37)-N6)-threonylcarbamoyltransferase complex ATPase subunit type 1 TsaE [Candidatus Saccharibacteria bacterium]|nr:tRNA (adenosine(37)-N6)-threonylcarbamoyltransferase complex ATPase subunit type 1 TsaE [Candidatus Saccharibacteria bacterium]